MDMAQKDFLLALVLRNCKFFVLFKIPPEGLFFQAFLFVLYRQSYRQVQCSHVSNHSTHSAGKLASGKEKGVADIQKGGYVT